MPTFIPSLTRGWVWFLAGWWISFVLLPTPLLAQGREEPPLSRVVDTVNLGAPSVESTVRRELEKSGVILEQNLSLPQAEAGPDKFALIGQQVIFDASLSRIPATTTSAVVFRWDFGDGRMGEGLRVVHLYERAGHYKAKLTLQVGNYQTSDEQIISVFERQVVLLSDEDLSTQTLTEINAKIRAYQTDIKSIRLGQQYPTRFLASQALAGKILSQHNFFADATFVFSYGLAGIEALQLANQQLDLGLRNKHIVILTTDEQPAWGSTTYAQFLLSRLQPKSLMFVSRNADFGPLIEAGDLPTGAFMVRPAEGTWAFLTFLREQLGAVLDKGFPSSSLIFLFLLLAASVFCLAVKRIIGFSDIDVFTTTLAITAMVYIGVLPGIVIFALFVLVSSLIHVGLYLNQLAVLPWNLVKYLGIALATIFGYLLLVLFYPQLAVIEIVFPVLVLAFAAEAFAFRLVSHGAVAAVGYLGQELGVLLAGSWFLSWPLLAWLALAFPGLYLVALLLLGVGLERYRGLRLTELRRFRNILVEEE